MKNLILALALLVCGSAQAVELEPLPIRECEKHAVYGFPSAKKEQTTVLCRKGYVLEYDNNAKIPIWVAYTLNAEQVLGCWSRHEKFLIDHSLPRQYISTTKDYAKSGYDTGHLANAADMNWDEQTAQEAALLSNMTPQVPEFNRGVWKRLEDRTRAWAHLRDTTIQIYAGSVYSVQSKTIGNQVRVPDSFFKILIDLKTDEVLVFMLKNEEGHLRLDEYLTSLAEVQRRTGLVLPMPAKRTFGTETWPARYKTIVAQKRRTCTQ